MLLQVLLAAGIGSLYYGEVECVGNKITGLVEKPISHLFVNAGIYLLEPAIRASLNPALHVKWMK